MVGEKQRRAQFGKNLERCKRAKMQDVDSDCRSDEMTESNGHFLFIDKKKSQELPKDTANASSNIAQDELRNRTVSLLRDPGVVSIDLNDEIHEPNNPASSEKSKGFRWDLNAEHKSNSPTEDPFFLFKNRETSRLCDESECGSTTGPLEEKDPMKVWKEMKQNGFLSSSHISVSLPKQRGRKSKNDGIIKKKMELAKKEQIDRFAKIAAPSGLLNDLNPGIINHVRNRKQVHSIIEALVRLEKKENHQTVGKQAVSDRGYTGGYVNGGCQVGPLGTLSMTQGTVRGGDSKAERWFFDKNSCTSSKKKDREDDLFALKLASSTTMGSENISSLSNVESGNLGTISSLSVKAADVAYHWMELLRQDIHGRLAALKRSKKRVRSVIDTELPVLLSREFSDSQENEPHFAKNVADLCSLSESADAHRAKWSVLFDQMDKTLAEEEKHLEIWLHQIIEMQLHCDQGLQSYPLYGSQRSGTSQIDHRLEIANKPERELAVQAAAASIYSTCNFLSSSENLPCF